MFVVLLEGAQPSSSGGGGGGPSLFKTFVEHPFFLSINIFVSAIVIAMIIERVEGSWSNVKGLPMERLREELARFAGV